MCDQTEVSYLPKDIVWVKLSNVWWPAEVQDLNDLDEEVTQGLRKQPLAVVKFLNEDKYEFVKNIEQICHYNSLKKFDFIRKGLDMKDKKHMEKFPEDVILAEKITKGNPNILKDPRLVKETEISHHNLFTYKGVKPKGVKGKTLPNGDSPLSTKSSVRISTPINHKRAQRTDRTAHYSKALLESISLRLDNDVIISRIDINSLYACPHTNCYQKFVCFETLAMHLKYFKHEDSNKDFRRLTPFLSRPRDRPSVKRKSDTETSSTKSKRKMAPDVKTDTSVKKQTKKKTSKGPKETVKKKDLSEAVRQKLLQDWSDSEEENLQDSLEVDGSPNESDKVPSVKDNEVRSPAKSCFDFEENDEAINLDESLKFGQKLPRVVNDKHKRDLDFKDSDKEVSHDIKDLNEDFNLIMKETVVASMPSLPEPFLSYSSVLPETTGKAEEKISDHGNEVGNRVTNKSEKEIAIKNELINETDQPSENDRVEQTKCSVSKETEKFKVEYPEEKISNKGDLFHDGLVVGKKHGSWQVSDKEITAASIQELKSIDECGNTSIRVNKDEESAVKSNDVDFPETKVLAGKLTDDKDVNKSVPTEEDGSLDAKDNEKPVTKIQEGKSIDKSKKRSTEISKEEVSLKVNDKNKSEIKIQDACSIDNKSKKISVIKDVGGSDRSEVMIQEKLIDNKGRKASVIKECSKKDKQYLGSFPDAVSSEGVVKKAAGKTNQIDLAIDNNNKIDDSSFSFKSNVVDKFGKKIESKSSKELKKKDEDSTMKDKECKKDETKSEKESSKKNKRPSSCAELPEKRSHRSSDGNDKKRLKIDPSESKKNDSPIKAEQDKEKKPSAKSRKEESPRKSVAKTFSQASSKSPVKCLSSLAETTRSSETSSKLASESNKKLDSGKSAKEGKHLKETSNLKRDEKAVSKKVDTEEMKPEEKGVMSSKNVEDSHRKSSKSDERRFSSGSSKKSSIVEPTKTNSASPKKPEVSKVSKSDDSNSTGELKSPLKDKNKSETKPKSVEEHPKKDKLKSESKRKSVKHESSNKKNEEHISSKVKENDSSSKERSKDESEKQRTSKVSEKVVAVRKPSIDSPKSEESKGGMKKDKHHSSSSAHKKRSSHSKERKDKSDLEKYGLSSGGDTVKTDGSSSSSSSPKLPPDTATCKKASDDKSPPKNVSKESKKIVTTPIKTTPKKSTQELINDLSSCAPSIASKKTPASFISSFQFDFTEPKTCVKPKIPKESKEAKSVTSMVQSEKVNSSIDNCKVVRHSELKGVTTDDPDTKSIEEQTKHSLGAGAEASKDGAEKEVEDKPRSDGSEAGSALSVESDASKSSFANQSSLYDLVSENSNMDTILASTLTSEGSSVDAKNVTPEITDVELEAVGTKEIPIHKNTAFDDHSVKHFETVNKDSKSSAKFDRTSSSLLSNFTLDVPEKQVKSTVIEDSVSLPEKGVLVEEGVISSEEMSAEVIISQDASAATKVVSTVEIEEMALAKELAGLASVVAVDADKKKEEGTVESRLQPDRVISSSSQQLSSAVIRPVQIEEHSAAVPSSMSVDIENASQLQQRAVQDDNSAKESSEKGINFIESCHTIKPIIVPPPSVFESTSNVASSTETKHETADQEVSHCSEVSNFAEQVINESTESGKSKEALLTSTDVQNMKLDINSMPFVFEDVPEIPASIAEAPNPPSKSRKVKKCMVYLCPKGQGWKKILEDNLDGYEIIKIPPKLPEKTPLAVSTPKRLPSILSKAIKPNILNSFQSLNAANRLVASDKSRALVSNKILVAKSPMGHGSKIILRPDSMGTTSLKSNDGKKQIIVLNRKLAPNTLSGSSILASSLSPASELIKKSAHGKILDSSSVISPPGSTIRLLSSKNQKLILTDPKQSGSPVTRLKMVLQKPEVRIPTSKDSKINTLTLVPDLSETGSINAAKMINTKTRSLNILGKARPKPIIREKQNLNIPSLPVQPEMTNCASLVDGSSNLSTLVINVNEANRAKPSEPVQIVENNKLIYISGSSSQSVYVPPSTSTSTQGQDILAKAIANTQVLQADPEAPCETEVYEEETIYSSEDIHQTGMENTFSLTQSAIATTEVQPSTSYFSVPKQIEPSMPLITDEVDSSQVLIQPNVTSSGQIFFFSNSEASSSQVLYSTVGSLGQMSGPTTQSQEQEKDRVTHDSVSDFLTFPSSKVSPVKTSCDITANVNLAEIELPPDNPPQESSPYKIEEAVVPPENIASIPLPPEPYKGNKGLSFTIARTKESVFKTQSPNRRFVSPPKDLPSRSLKFLTDFKPSNS